MSDDQAWLRQMPADDQQRAQKIVTALQELGCDEPRAWARTEISENIPQLARYRFLRSLWPEMIDSWRSGIDNIPAARRAIGSGADPHDVAQLARAVAYATVFAMLDHLADDEPDEGMPTWVLTEVDPAGYLTGRHFDALDEDLLSLDPSRHDRGDLWT
jgi:hypothetical protein